MANTIDLNVSPYYDDFDPTKDYLRVLFRPGYPVQGRELNTLQSFLQEQVARHGNFVFRDGSRVTQGGIGFDNEVSRLTLTSSGNSSYPPANAAAGAILSNIESFEGKMITNASGTVKARVLTQPISTTKTSSVGDLYIKYSTEKTFDSDGGYIYARVSDNPGMTADLYNTYSNFTNASIATVDEGVYYIREHFTRMPRQTVVVDAKSSYPSKEIGFIVSSTFVTQNDDNSLYDIATGSPNEGAPGAHRFRQSVTFAVKDIDEETANNFYLVLKIVEGQVQSQPKLNPELSALGDELARRTYDESGHYTVSPYSVYALPSDSEEKFIAKISKGKAYVKGYEIETITDTNIKLDKALDTKRVSNYKISLPGTTGVVLASDNGGDLPGWNGGAESSYVNRLLLKDSDGDVIGFCKAYSYRNEFEKGVAQNKLYVYDIKFFQVLTLSGTSFSLQTGNDVYYNQTKGYYYTDATDTSWLATNQIALLGHNNAFRIGQPIQSTVGTISETVTARKVYDWSDVTNIEDDFGIFVGVYQPGSVFNTNASLVTSIDGVFKTAKDAGGVFDNNMTVLTHTGVDNGTPTVEWNETNVDDVESVDKTLKFAYLHIKNVAGSRTNINYGWLAQDREMHLGYPDIQKVYKVTKTITNTIDGGQFQRLDITTSGVLAQGTVLTGVTSGSKCVVALSNTATLGLTDLSAGSGYHEIKTGTGNSSLVEVVWQKGSRFTAGESLVAETPVGVADYTALITYNSVGTEVGEDFTEQFYYDNGQRAEYYDIGRLVRQKNVPDPGTGESFVVFFSYWEADPALLGYYNGDSYTQEGFYDVDVRYINSLQAIEEKNVDNGVDLRNMYDFRLRHSGATTDITTSPFAYNARAFISQPRLVPKSVFTTDIDIYLPRIDILSLDKDGSFRIIRGKSETAANVRPPQVPADSMHVATIGMKPAERYPERNTRIEIIDNKRYTMRDIGVLDRRIGRVEEAVSLSILESQALNDNIEDRQRVGFVTDNFSSLGTTFGDIDHQDFNAAILSDRGELVPAMTEGSPVQLELTASNNIDEWYLNNGKGHVVMAYTESMMIQQLDVTGCHLINPFATWSYQGVIKLDPFKHYWREPVYSYFVRTNGLTQPFTGDSDAFWALSRITEPDPNGWTETSRSWTTREERTLTTREMLTPDVEIPNYKGPVKGGRWVDTTDPRSMTRVVRRGDDLVTTTKQEKVTTNTVTTRTSKEPVSIGTTTTASGREIQPFPEAYKITPITINFEVKGLKPNTEHRLKFSGDAATDIVGTDVGTFTSNDQGEVSGSFGIPRSKYNIGSHMVTIESVTSPFGSFADGIFSATGHFEYFDVLLDRQTLSETITETKGGTWETTSTRSRRVSRDPIAQTFMLPAENATDATKILTNEAGERQSSAFITSVDLWFCTVDSRPNMNRVIVEIRETVNGYPAGPDRVIGAAEVYVDPDVYSQVDGSQVVTDDKAVNFRFPNPVKLDGDKEYCIVVLTPSDGSSVLVAEMGQKLIGKNGVHDEQPNIGGHYGSFFVSQNSTTWNAEQNIDLTFRMNRADFGVDAADATLTMANTPSNGFSNSDLFTKGVTANAHRADIGTRFRGLCLETFVNSNYVRVFHPNHGLNYDGAQTILWNMDETYPNGSAKTVNGIPFAQITKGVTESTFKTATTGHTVYYPTLNSYFIKTTTKATSSGIVNTGLRTSAVQDLVYDAVISNASPLIFDGTNVAQTMNCKTTCSSNLGVANNKFINNSLSVVTTDSVEKTIPINSVYLFDEPKIVRSAINATTNFDLQTTFTLSTNDRYVSPIIPYGRNLDPICIRMVTGDLLDDSDIALLKDSEATLQSSDDDLLEMISYHAAVQSNEEHSGYVTKEINVEIPANAIDIFFDADMMPGTSLEFFYKVRQAGDEILFEDIEWQSFNIDQFVNEKNYGDFSTLPNNRQYSAHQSVGVDFSAFKVKIRMNCQNEALFPVIRNLRLIADIEV